MTIKETIKWAKTELIESCERPQYESELLLAYHLKQDRMYLITHDTDRVENVDLFKKIVARRKANEPYEYIVGSVY